MSRKLIALAYDKLSYIILLILCLTVFNFAYDMLAVCKLFSSTFEGFDLTRTAVALN